MEKYTLNDCTPGCRIRRCIYNRCTCSVSIRMNNFFEQWSEDFDSLPASVVAGCEELEIGITDGVYLVAGALYEEFFIRVRS